MNCAQAQKDLQSSLQTSGGFQSPLEVMSLCPESLSPLPEFAQTVLAFFVHCVCAHCQVSCKVVMGCDMHVPVVAR